jgi:hypothetical protein
MYEQRISKRNGMHAKDILKTAAAAVGEKIKKTVDKALNTNHQCEVHLKKLICQLYSRRRQLQQAFVKKRQSDAFKLKLFIVRSNGKKQFDIAICSCPDLGNCSCRKEFMVRFFKIFWFSSQNQLNVIGAQTSSCVFDRSKKYARS